MLKDLLSSLGFVVARNQSVPVALLLVVGYVVYIGTKHGKNRGKNKCPPYAPGGMLKHIQMVSSSEYPWWVLDVARQLNTRIFQISVPIRPSVSKFVIGEPKVFRQVLTDPSSEKPRDIYGAMADLNAGGKDTMFTLNGDAWHSKRKAIAPAFSSRQVKRMTHMALEKTDEWIQDTLMNSNKETTFDVSQAILGIVLAAITETAFDYKMTLKEQKHFSEELEIALIEFALKTPSNPLRTLFGWFLPERRRARLAAKNLTELAVKIMDQYRKNESPTEGTVIQLIMESDDAYPTDEDKAAEVILFLVGGHDTTSFSIAWILLELARNPNEQKKLRESLSQLAPENWSRSETLKMVVNEGMRLHPVASAGSIRVIGKDITTSRNELLPKGSIAFLPFILMFRNPDIFDDPDLFAPSRWENPTRDMLDAFNPFALGKQNCLGQSLAKAETFAIVARICSEFELAVEEEGSVDFFLTLKP
ncbi:hypothetical protein ACHAWF_001941, partial [Thalassiosira exigua]